MSKQDIKDTCDCKKECKQENCEKHKEKMQKMAELESKANQYLEMAQRLQAEFDNYRKKSENLVQAARLDGKIEAVGTLIPSLDSFKQAKKVITDAKILEGVELIEKDILTALAEIGVEKIECVGGKFDPNFHNALATQNNPDLEDEIIIDEYQAGYKIKDKIIRYSQVIVNKREV